MMSSCIYLKKNKNKKNNSVLCRKNIPPDVRQTHFSKLLLVFVHQMAAVFWIRWSSVAVLSLVVVSNKTKNKNKNKNKNKKKL